MGKRYFGLTKDEKNQMLAELKINSVDELYEKKECFLKAIPQTQFLDWMSEQSVVKFFQSIESKNNKPKTSFLGNGTYNHYIPSVVYSVIQRSEFLTSYTPYQPEISQGILMAMFEFQEIISRITGMDISNASMYDCATSTVEAIMMSIRVTNNKKVFIDKSTVREQYIEVIETYAKYTDFIIDYEDPSNSACIVFQSPDKIGNIKCYNEYYEQKNQYNALLIVVVDEILSLGMTEPPINADIVVGDVGSLSINNSFGGSSLGFFACKKKFITQMPGKISGKTKDKSGNDCFALALAFREQHIRRGRASSNICTNQFLLALAFTVHISLLGSSGFIDLAKTNHANALSLYNLLNDIDGIEVISNTFFNEFAITTPGIQSDQIINTMSKKYNIEAGYKINEFTTLISVTEMNSKKDITEYFDSLCKIIKSHKQ